MVGEHYYCSFIVENKCIVFLGQSTLMLKAFGAKSSYCRKILLFFMGGESQIIRQHVLAEYLGFTVAVHQVLGSPSLSVSLRLYDHVLYSSSHVESVTYLTSVHIC